jgi:hypothetical protein
MSEFKCAGQPCSDFELSFLIKVAESASATNQVVEQGYSLAAQMLENGGCRGAEVDAIDNTLRCTNPNAKPAALVLRAALTAEPEPPLRSLADALRVNISEQGLLTNSK